MPRNRSIQISKVTLALLLTVLTGYVLATHLAGIKSSAATRDSIAYWSAARLLVEGQDPYDYGGVLSLEGQAGYLGDRPLILRTPPWSLFMVIPLGFLGPFGAWALWMICCFACLLAGIRISRKLFGAEPSIPGNLFSLVGYTFAPVAACLVSGQMGLLLMLGVALFLWWETERPFLAGAALVLPFAKPHLLSLFWFAVLSWAIFRRKGRLALGFVIALSAAMTIALFLDHQIFQHYLELVHSGSIEREFIPALSGVIRLIFFRRLFWVQLVPTAVGLIWCSWFFFSKLSTWSWREQGPALLVASVLVTPYSWLADETVLLPAILQAAVFTYQVRSILRLHNRIAILVLALLNVLLLLILRAKIPFATGIYFWSSLVWTFWYFHAYSLHARYQQSSPLPVADVQPAV